MSSLADFNDVDEGEVMAVRGGTCVLDARWMRLLENEAWFIDSKGGGVVRLSGGMGLRGVGLKRQRILLSRLIGGYPRPFRIRYKNKDSLDYREGNLEAEWEGLKYRVLGGVGLDGKFKGVVFERASGMWEVRLPGVGYGLDRFRTVLEAAIRYNELIRGLFGRNADVNDLGEYREAFASVGVVV